MIPASPSPFPTERRAALLFYKKSCPPCRWMSRTAVVLSLGTIRRVALDSSRAQEFYLRYPKRSGQLVLVAGDRVTFGRGVFLAVPLAIVHALADYARQIFAIVFKHLSGKARRIDGEEL